MITTTSKYIIYALIDPRDDQVRYIGLSSTGIKRAKTHGYPSSRKIRSYKNNWINNLFLEGFEFKIKIIEECFTYDQLPEKEKYWISYYKKLGSKLTNLTDGGEGAFNPSEETRRKKSEKQKLPRPIINEILHRPCGYCKKTKPVTEFHKNKSNCDGYASRCICCAKLHRINNIEVYKERRKKQYNKGTEYNKVNYLEKIITKQKAAQKARLCFIEKNKDPEFRKSLGKANRKALIAILIKNPDIKLYFDSAISAKEKGYCNRSICRSIKQNKPYKGYFWQFN